MPKKYYYYYYYITLFHTFYMLILFRVDKLSMELMSTSIFNSLGELENKKIEIDNDYIVNLFSCDASITRRYINIINLEFKIKILV
jgi:hypothetical protein